MKRSNCNECPYCGLMRKPLFDDGKGQSLYIDYDHSMTINYMDGGVPEFFWISSKIAKYCPVCGRKLEVK